MSTKTSHRRRHNRAAKKLAKIAATDHASVESLLWGAIGRELAPAVCDQCGWGLSTYAHYTECRGSAA